MKSEADYDTLFTMAAYYAVNREHEEAIEVLHRLTSLDQHYPGLWFLKARVFELMGMRDAAQSAMKRALESSGQFVQGT